MKQILILLAFSFPCSLTAQVYSNVDALVLGGDVLDNVITDVTLTGASNNDIVAAAAVKAYIDNVVAADIAVSPTGNLASSTVQAALEELQTDIDGLGGSSAAFATTANITSNSPGDPAADDFVFGSTSLDYVTAENNRLQFDRSKGAIFAGHATTTEADDANRGFFSSNFGGDNITSGFSSGVIGSFNSTVSAQMAAGVACIDCIIEADNSIATGQDARTRLLNQHSHAGGGDIQSGHHQYTRLIAWNDFSGTGTATLFLNGSFSRLLIPNNTIWGGEVHCTALVKTGGTGTSVGDHKKYAGEFVAKNISGTVSVQWLDKTSALLDTPSFDSSVLSLQPDNTNDAVTVLITNIPGGATSITHLNCVLEYSESGY